MRLTKGLGIITASTLMSAGAIFAAAGTASAEPATPVFCNGHYLCVEEVGQSIDTMYIDMWAPTDSFKGHFQLQTPENTSTSSRNLENLTGSGHAVTLTVPVDYGKYCATAWKYNGGTSYTKLGYLCFTAGA